MKLFALLLITATAYGQNPPYRVVFDVTSGDTSVHKSVVRWIDAITKSNPDAQIEVVMYGQALDLVIKNKSVVAPAIERLLSKVNFKVCAMSMERHNVKKSELFKGVEAVEDGIYQIITRQSEGWGYIKATQ